LEVKTMIILLAALVAVVPTTALMVTGCSQTEDMNTAPVAPDITATQLDGMATTDTSEFVVEPLSEDEIDAYLLTAQQEEPSGKFLSARILTGVRFAPQVRPGSWALTMSCGPASINLDAAYLWGVVPDQVRYIRLINSYLHKTDINNCLPGGTSTSDLERAARAVNNCPNTYRASGWTLQRVRQEIDAGRPVVVAVKAGYLPNRGYKYTGGHFVLVVGYENGYMVCHDPGTSGGAFKRYSNYDFLRAMSYFGGAVVVVRR
jgi:hypothetical protein